MLHYDSRYSRDHLCVVYTWNVAALDNGLNVCRELFANRLNVELDVPVNLAATAASLLDCTGAQRGGQNNQERTTSF